MGFLHFIIVRPFYDVHKVNASWGVVSVYSSVCSPALFISEATERVSLMVKLQVLTAASMKMTVLWDVVPCSLVEVYRRFGGAYCLHHQGEHCKYKTAWHRNSENHNSNALRVSENRVLRGLFGPK
jgi:hypothetical protein